VLEWARPPDAYDRNFVAENQRVRVRVAVPGVGKRLVKEWHEGMVLDVRRSRASVDFGMAWEEENMQKVNHCRTTSASTSTSIASSSHPCPYGCSYCLSFVLL